MLRERQRDHAGLESEPRVLTWSYGSAIVLLMRAAMVIAWVSLATVGCESVSPPPRDAATPIACAADGECDDGSFCNGVERCIGAECRAAAPSCDPGRICDEPGRRCLTDCAVAEDADGDGALALECSGQDCDDGDATRHPGAIESCDVGATDEDCDPRTFGVRDLDGDGFADAQCCNGATCGTDCDDARSGAHPAATEACNGFDDDCDGASDEGVLAEWLPDLDGDGFGSEASGRRIVACARPEAHADRGGDCDDARAAVHPGAVEICDAAGADEDCNGFPDDVPGGCDCVEGTTRGCSATGRCAGATQACVGGRWASCSIEPVPETCDGTDEDCNGTVDDELRVTCWLDADGDGFARGDAPAEPQCRDEARAAAPFSGCPTGYTGRVPVSRLERDCDDGASSVTWATLCYADADLDTYGAGASIERCVSSGSCDDGFASRAGDCCDLERLAHPGASSSPVMRSGCGGWDFDCDGASTVQWNNSGACSGRTTMGTCTIGVVSGWYPLGSVPACGVSQRWVSTCGWTGSCGDGAWEMRTQRCR